MMLLRNLLAAGFYALLVPIVALTSFPWTLLTGRVEFLYRFATWVAITGVRVAGVRIQIEGRDCIDAAGTYVFMSNHASNLDPPIVVPLIPRRTSVLAKHSLFRIPIFGHALKLGSLVPVDRSNRDAAIASLRRATEVLKGGLNMTVFPEGTRSWDGQLLPFKKGPFYMAMDAGVAIVPVSIHNTHRLLPKGKLLARPGTVRLVFHQPVHPIDFPGRDALMEAVRSTIADALAADAGGAEAGVARG
jgi:1-acyl-sn-glycerol-3-phosphate acyltransferase